MSSAVILILMILILMQCLYVRVNEFVWLAIFFTVKVFISTYLTLCACALVYCFVPIYLFGCFSV